jgi:hypothetical protein
MRHSVDYLYSLYDALVSINVPTDKARALVDAMERDMSATIATKADLQLLRQELVGQMALLATRDEVVSIRSEIASVRGELAGLRQDQVLVRTEMDLMASNLSQQLTVRMGSMLVVSLGLLFAALKLT